MKILCHQAKRELLTRSDGFFFLSLRSKPIGSARDDASAFTWSGIMFCRNVFELLWYCSLITTVFITVVFMLILHFSNRIGRTINQSEFLSTYLDNFHSYPSEFKLRALDWPSQLSTIFIFISVIIFVFAFFYFFFFCFL